MGSFGIFLFFLGALTTIYGWIRLTFVTLKENQVLGIMSLICFPILSLVVVFMNWKDSKWHFFTFLLGGLEMTVGIWIEQMGAG